MGIRIDLSTCRKCKTLLPCLRPLLSNPVPHRDRPTNMIKAGAKVTLDQPLSRIALGWVYAIEKKWKKAEKHLNAALSIEPNNELALALLENVVNANAVTTNAGIIRKTRAPAERHNDALMALRERRAQGDLKAAFDLGLFYYNKHRPVPAIKAFMQAHNADKNNLNIRYYLALAYLLRGFELPKPSDEVSFETAENHLNFILAKDRGNVQARIAMAKLRLLQGKRTACVRMLKKLLSIDSNANALHLFALADFDQSIAYATKHHMGEETREALRALHEADELTRAKVIFNMVNEFFLSKEVRF